MRQGTSIRSPRQSAHGKPRPSKQQTSEPSALTASVFSASDDIASSSGSCRTCSAEKAHDVFAKLWAYSGCTESSAVPSRIFGMACDEIAARRGPWYNRRVAKAHAVLERFCIANCALLRRAASASASRPGLCTKLREAKAHAVLEHDCGPKALMVGRAAAAIAVSKANAATPAPQKPTPKWTDAVDRRRTPPRRDSTWARLPASRSPGLLAALCRRPPPHRPPRTFAVRLRGFD
eukprot:CAMPEP_0171088524 /NCGR_PEP_ID=MMETSP0766_2-20121228/20835_1 /TAXON_ID=439317 /ORGANISM="Gambierdiscus australes, Strain CAWD 149" /LENGTH=234 /DNA_ID=CAMNT_0011546327 /DNA_START=117 /DNA_END=822 /DNA_ORIENTATION=-